MPTSFWKVSFYMTLMGSFNGILELTNCILKSALWVRGSACIIFLLKGVSIVTRCISYFLATDQDLGNSEDLSFINSHSSFHVSNTIYIKRNNIWYWIVRINEKAEMWDSYLRAKNAIFRYVIRKLILILNSAGPFEIVSWSLMYIFGQMYKLARCWEKEIYLYW